MKDDRFNELFGPVIHKAEVDAEAEREVSDLDVSILHQEGPTAGDLSAIEAEDRGIASKAISDLVGAAIDNPTPYFGLNVVKPSIGRIPEPRKIIYSGYIKSLLTGISATGGTGKTSLVDVEIASLAIGKDLFDDRKPIKAGPQKVLVMSLEDPQDEFQRRIEALHRHYQLTDEELALFHSNVTTVMGLTYEQKLAHRADKGDTRNEPAIRAVKDLVRDLGADVVTIDPLISCHQVGEDTQGMQMIASILREIAQECDVAVHFAHHNRKGDGNSADDMRGGVSLRDAARKIRMLTRMTEKEAENHGVPKDEFVRYIGMYDGKNNLEPPGASKLWYKMLSVDLDNATDHFNADNIGVAVKIGYLKAKDPLADVTPAQAEHIMLHIASLPPERRRKSPQASGYVGEEIARCLGMDYGSGEDGKAVRDMVNAWVGCRMLAEDEPIRGQNGNKQPTLKYTGMAFA